MGLPLFVAPVESDIPKRAEKNSADPAHARSTIRRRSRPLNPLSDRLRVVYEEQRRLRLLSGLRERDDSAQPPPVSGLPSSIGLLIDDDDDIFNGTLGPRLRRQQEQYQLERRQRELQQERRQLERRQQEHRQRERRLLDRSTQGRSEQENREARAGRPRAFFGTTLANAQEAPSPASPSIWVGRAPTSTPPHFTTRLDPPPGYDVSIGRQTSPFSRMRWSQRMQQQQQQPQQQQQQQPQPQQQQQQQQQTASNMLERLQADLHDLESFSHARHARFMDGLGDRNRSLSPEGDEVWDILQSTLTPDPQPPSIGSSFASATTSATASQNTSVNPSTNLSANTSVTSPDGDLEPPCDHEFDETPDDGDADEAADQRTEPQGRPTPHDRRSYADVASATMSDFAPAEDGGDRTPDPEWLANMYDIVSRLASRQDIPDEWWAHAGLSRSMSHEGNGF